MEYEIVLDNLIDYASTRDNLYLKTRLRLLKKQIEVDILKSEINQIKQMKSKLKKLSE